MTTLTHRLSKFAHTDIFAHITEIDDYIDHTELLPEWEDDDNPYAYLNDYMDDEDVYVPEEYGPAGAKHRSEEFQPEFPKLTGYEGLVHWRGLHGKDTSFTRDDYTIAMRNKRFNKIALDDGVTKAGRRRGKPDDPSVIARLRQVNKALFLEPGNPLLRYMRDQFGYTPEKFMERCTYYVTKKGEIRITHVDDATIEGWKEKNKFYEWHEDFDKDIRVEENSTMVRVGDNIIKRELAARVGAMLVCYQFSRWGQVPLATVSANDACTRGGNHYRKLLRHSIIKYISRHIRLKYSIDFAGLHGGVYDHLGGSSDGNLALLFHNSVTNSEWMNNTTGRWLSKTPSEIEAIIRDFRNNPTLTPLTPVDKPNQINGNNGSATNTDDHPGPYDVRFYNIIGNDNGFVLQFGPHSPSLDRLLHQLVTNHVSFGEGPVVLHMTESETVVLSDYHYEAMFSIACVYQVGMRPYSASNNAPIAIVGDCLRVEYLQDTWTYDVRRYRGPRTRINGDSLLLPSLMDTLWSPPQIMVFGMFSDRLEPYVEFGPEYSSDNAGDGPGDRHLNVKIGNTGRSLHLLTCDKTNCTDSVHLHLLPYKSKGKQGSVDHPAKTRIDQKTSKNKEFDLFKRVSICALSGCTDPTHMHISNKDPNLSRKMRVLLARYHKHMQHTQSFMDFVNEGQDAICHVINKGTLASDFTKPEIVAATQEVLTSMEEEPHTNIKPELAVGQFGDEYEDGDGYAYQPGPKGGNKLVAVNDSYHNRDGKMEVDAINGGVAKKGELPNGKPASLKQGLGKRKSGDKPLPKPLLKRSTALEVDEEGFIEIGDLFATGSETSEFNNSNPLHDAEIHLASSNVQAATPDVAPNTASQAVNQNPPTGGEPTGCHPRDNHHFYSPLSDDSNVFTTTLTPNVPATTPDVAKNTVSQTVNQNPPFGGEPTGCDPRDNHHFYSVLSDDSNMFTTTLKGDNGKRVYTMWRRDPSQEQPVYYAYQPGLGEYAGNAWRYGVLRPGVHDGVVYSTENMCAIRCRGGMGCMLSPDVSVEEMTIEAKDYEWFAMLRKTATQMTKSLDFTKVLDGTGYDGKEFGYQQTTKKATLPVSQTMMSYLLQKKAHVSTVGSTCMSVYLTVTTEYPGLPIELYLGTLLKFLRVRVEVQKTLQALTKHSVDHLSKTVGDTTGITFIKTAMSGVGTRYSVRTSHTSVGEGWIRPDNTASGEDVAILDRLTDTDTSAYNCIDNPIQPTSSKFEVLAVKGVEMNGVLPRFVEDPIDDNDLKLFKAVYCTMATRASTANPHSGVNCAIGLNRILLDRPDEDAKRARQTELAGLAMLVMGWYTYIEHGDVGLDRLQRAHDELCRLVMADNPKTAHHHEFGVRYNFDILGRKLGPGEQSISWGEMKRQYYEPAERNGGSSHLFQVISDELDGPEQRGLVAKIAWMIGAKYYIRTHIDEELTSVITEHGINTLDAMEAYFVELGGDKLAYRLELIAQARRYEPEFKRVFNNTIQIKTGEILKQKEAKVGPLKGSMVEQYLRTVVSIVGQSYLDAAPDIIAANKEHVARHPIQFCKHPDYTTCRLLYWDHELVTLECFEGRSLHLPFTIDRDIVIASAVCDGDSGKLSKMYSTFNKSPLLHDAYIGFSFGDDMVAKDKRDQTWAEADISANDGSYTDALCRIPMYTSSLVSGDLCIPAWAQRARPYKYQPPSGVGYVIYGSSTGINLPSGSSLTTSQNTDASGDLHIAEAMGGREFAQYVTGFDLSGVPPTAQCTHVGFLSNINYEDDVTGNVYCVSHPGIALRSFGMSKSATWVLDKSLKRYKTHKERGYIFTLQTLLGYISTHSAMAEGVTWPEVIEGRVVYQSSSHCGVPTYLLALAEMLVVSRPKTLSLTSIVMSTALVGMWLRLVSAAREYRNRIGGGMPEEFRPDPTDIIIASAYTTPAIGKFDGVSSSLESYRDFLVRVVDVDPTLGNYGCRFEHQFVDSAMKMRYSATGYT